MSPSGKATDFDSVKRRFDSFHPRKLSAFSSVVEQGSPKPCVGGSIPSKRELNINNIYIINIIIINYNEKYFRNF